MIKSRTDDAERECKSPLYGEKKVDIDNEL